MRPKTLGPEPCPVCGGKVETAWGYATRAQCCSTRCRQVLYRRRKEARYVALMAACEAVRDAFADTDPADLPPAAARALAQVDAALILEPHGFQALQDGAAA